MVFLSSIIGCRFTIVLMFARFIVLLLMISDLIGPPIPAIISLSRLACRNSDIYLVSAIIFYSSSICTKPTPNSSICPIRFHHYIGNAKNIRFDFWITRIRCRLLDPCSDQYQPLICTQTPHVPISSLVPLLFAPTENHAWAFLHLCMQEASSVIWTTSTHHIGLWCYIPTPNYHAPFSSSCDNKHTSTVTLSRVSTKSNSTATDQTCRRPRFASGRLPRRPHGFTHEPLRASIACCQASHAPPAHHWCFAQHPRRPRCATTHPSSACHCDHQQASDLPPWGVTPRMMRCALSHVIIDESLITPSWSIYSSSPRSYPCNRFDYFFSSSPWRLRRSSPSTRHHLLLVCSPTDSSL